MKMMLGDIHILFVSLKRLIWPSHLYLIVLFLLPVNLHLCTLTTLYLSLFPSLYFYSSLYLYPFLYPSLFYLSLYRHLFLYSYFSTYLPSPSSPSGQVYEKMEDENTACHWQTEAHRHYPVNLNVIRSVNGMSALVATAPLLLVYLILHVSMNLLIRL